MVATVAHIAHLTRAKDWRLTFIPFILGCVYLWLLWFSTPFSVDAIVLFCLSLATALGFAALGYLTNEYFDQDDDLRAGKLNRIAHATAPLRFVLMLAALLLALLPWLWLPSNAYTWLLIASELCCFALYSLPFPRFKKIPFISNLIDMAYAYTIPLVLSFHTYSLFHAQVWPTWLWPLVACVSFIGLRGIIIHQVDDLFNDKRAGLHTLPSTIGPEATSLVLAFLLMAECLAFLVFAIMLSVAMPWWATSVLLAFLGFVALLALGQNNIHLRFLPITPPRHATDQFYQIIFPMIALVLLAFSHPWWAILIPLHMGIMVPLHVMQRVWHSGRYAADRVYYRGIRTPINATVNYGLYYGFLIIGVDLKRENISAAQYLRRRFQS